MRSARLTYVSAWHHVMCHGHEEKRIFEEAEWRDEFVGLLAKACEKYRMRLVASCVLSPHYHLSLPNTSGELSESMKWHNGAWGRRYRKLVGGRGAVFQGRFKSTLVKDEPYPGNVLRYILMNPVEAGMVVDPWEHPHSRIHAYDAEGPDFVDLTEVRRRFPTERALTGFLKAEPAVLPPVVDVRAGKVVGTPEDAEEALRRFDRRKERRPAARKRVGESPFRTVEEVVRDIESAEGVEPGRLDFGTYRGKRIRARLLVALKEQAGLSYAEIAALPWFRDLKVASLGSIYADAKRRGRGG